MTIPRKLKAILQLSELSQTELARKIGVTFAALNRWVNGKAVPRKKMQEKIDELYRGYTGLRVIPKQELEAMKLKVVHEGFKVKYIPDPEELAAARALGEKLAQEVGLLGDALRFFVTGEVAVVRLHFLVLVLVGQTVVGDEGADQVRESGRVVDALGFILGETGLVVGGLDNGDELGTLRVAGHDGT